MLPINTSVITPRPQLQNRNNQPSTNHPPTNNRNQPPTNNRNLQPTTATNHPTRRHADLDAFEPARYLSAASNGDHGAGVLLSAVDAAPPVSRSHPAVLAAAELGLPHAALLRNLANSALRRAAAAGDARALTPGGEYVPPEEVAEAAVLSVAMRDALAGGGEAADEASVAAQAAAAEAAAAPVALAPAALQLPMPPQLPLYHSAVLQHLRVRVRAGVCECVCSVVLACILFAML